MNKRILIFYDHFTPAYKAGGPIQSLTNLVRQLHEHFDFYVFTTNQDHDGTALAVVADEFVDFEQKAHVFYASPSQRKYATVKRLIQDVSPDVVYLNGMFSVLCVVFPLMVLRKMPAIRVVLAPRGMLQSGALKLKRVKKALYLVVLKSFFLSDQYYWHATDDVEQEDIAQSMSRHGPIILAENIPAVINAQKSRVKAKGVLRMVTISLVARKKNHAQLLRALAKVNPDAEVHYDIFGPKVDDQYWNECATLIPKLPSNAQVNYKGILSRDEIGPALGKYDIFVLPSFGENFGHAIFEALSSGLPVIISDQTPWRNLAQKKAGWDVSLEDTGALENALNQAIAMEQDEYETWCKGARQLALDYLDKSDFRAAYQRLFDESECIRQTR